MHIEAHLHLIAAQHIHSAYLPITLRFLAYIEQSLKLKTNGKPEGWAVAIYAYILDINHYHFAEEFCIKELAAKLDVNFVTVKNRCNQINDAAGSIDAEPWLLPEVKALLDEIIDDQDPEIDLQNMLPKDFFHATTAQDDDSDDEHEEDMPEEVKQVMRAIRQSLDDLMDKGDPTIADVVNLIEELGGEVIQKKAMIDIPNQLPAHIKQHLAQGKSRGRGMLPPLMLQVMVQSNQATKNAPRPKNKYPIASQLIH